MAIVKYIFIICLIAFGAVACTTAPSTTADIGDEPVFDANLFEEQPLVEEAPATDEPAQQESIKHVIGNPAIMSLWQKSKQFEETGDLDEAILQIERAVRIEEEDAILWSRLAELNLKIGNANQAEALAELSNGLPITDNILLYRNWLIIADARRQLGDLSGAEEAEYTASTFR